MNDLLVLLADPRLVALWYETGLLSALWIARDEKTHNTDIGKAMKWSWPILALFFSVIGLALYLLVGRPPRIRKRRSMGEGAAATDQHLARTGVKVAGSVAHCVAGDGVGIVTAMVIARLLRMSPWQEFWFEYALGFAFGWLIFQYVSMLAMTDTAGRALAMAFRAEFFSMMAVMGGMGAVMMWVTPSVVGAQPQPSTAAFWGFAALGLLAGYALGLPMNWLLVLVGWKQAERGDVPVERSARRSALMSAMVAAGIACLVLPAWLYERLEQQPVLGPPRMGGMSPAPAGLTELRAGFASSAGAASRRLREGRRDGAMAALDGAMRISEIGTAMDCAPFPVARALVREARQAVQNGSPSRGDDVMGMAGWLVAEEKDAGPGCVPRIHDPSYRGALLVDANGSRIGEVVAVRADHVVVEVGGIRDVWGFLDLTSGLSFALPREAVLFGPSRWIGPTLVALPVPET